MAKQGIRHAAAPNYDSSYSFPFRSQTACRPSGTLGLHGRGNHGKQYFVTTNPTNVTCKACLALLAKAVR